MDVYTEKKLIKDIRPELCIIAQSAYITDREEVLKSGCSDFINKPFQKEELLSVIKKYLFSGTL